MFHFSVTLFGPPVALVKVGALPGLVSVQVGGAAGDVPPTDPPPVPGDAVGLGEGDGDGDGDGLGEGDGLGLGDGETPGAAVGDGLGLGSATVTVNASELHALASSAEGLLSGAVGAIDFARLW